MNFDETAWVAIAFVLFIALIWKKGSQAVISILDNRTKLIEAELNQAKSLKEEAMEELRQSLQIQKNISEEADIIIKEAKENAKLIIEEAKLKSKENIKRKEDQADQKILALETEALNKIKKITGSIVIESSKIYIEENLDNKEKGNLLTQSTNEIKSASIL